MRILHLSDFHYCETKHDDFLEFREKLMVELEAIHGVRNIDFVILTGDLLDKGGKNFKSQKENPYKIFEKEVISPIINCISLPQHKVMMIPGNHDIDDVKKDDYIEAGLVAQDISSINKIVSKERLGYTSATSRIKNYKEFEANFYSSFSSCQLSPFESCWVQILNNIKIGFVGLNSAWRCSTNLQDGKLIIGADKQIAFAKRFFSTHNTDFNIALLHHPIEILGESERNEIEILLKNAKISLIFGGHNHKVTNFQTIRSNNNVQLFQTLSRIAFTDKRENDESYQAGFTIVDLSSTSLEKNNITIDCSFYKYVNSHSGFDMDVLGGKSGKACYSISNKDCSEQFFHYLSTVKPATSSSKEQIIEAHNRAKKELVTLWSGLTVSLIHSSFKNISEKLADNIKRTMLLDEEQFYNTYNIFTYYIDDFDDDHFELIEEHTFTINTDKDSINFQRTFIVEKLQESNDLSNVFIDKLIINETDYKSHIKIAEPEKTIDPRTQKLKTYFDITLQSNSHYNVTLLVRSIHTHRLNGYWRRFFSEITDGVTVNLPENDDYEIDMLNFAKDMDFRKGFVPLGKGVNIEPTLFMPGDGFALIIKKKIKI